MPVRAPDVREVRPTLEEKEDWYAKHPRQYPPYRVECKKCEKRMWLSGIGLGAHRRACKNRAQAGPLTPSPAPVPDDTSGEVSKGRASCTR